MRLIFALLLFSSSALAQPLPIQLIAAHRTDITDVEQVAIVETGLSRLKLLNARLRPWISSVRIVNDDFNINALEFPQKQRLDTWAARYKSLLSRDVTTLFSVPPLISGSTNYGAGRAAQTCGIGTRSNYAYVVVRKFNAAGQPRELASATAIAHEISHLLGASHIDEIGTMHGPQEVPNIMHPDAGKFGNVFLPFIKWATGYEVDKCLRRRKLK